jgi:hypothetical protein
MFFCCHFLVSVKGYQRKNVKRIIGLLAASLWFPHYLEKKGLFCVCNILIISFYICNKRQIKLFESIGSLPIGQSSSSTSAVVDSVVELLYQLCTMLDEATKDRVNALLFWLHETGSAAVQVYSALSLVGTLT